MFRASWALFCVLLFSGGLCPAQTALEFTRDVRPILSDHCFQCHGPDEQTRAADLRLDQQAAAYEDRGGYFAIVPGEPDRSDLVDRIMTADTDLQMPPAEANKPLTEDEKATLVRWIKEGAEYRQHWAFVAPTAERPPTAPDDHVPSPIDAFVRRRLAENHLQPNPESPRAVLARRVALDLTGLPPDPDDVKAFEQDTRPDAFERWVDRMLASPSYGERWARRWLDLARYSDTNGYEKDRPRSMWPYRDWVISALNQDLPFDRFSVAQLAGDMLPQSTQETRTATGFHRNTMVNEEGGVDPQEFRFLATIDRVNTTATTWLGLTLGCCQCHTHKFDPFTQQEYYELFAFLNNADEPSMEVRNQEITAQRQEAEQQIENLILQLADKFPPPTDTAETEGLSPEQLRDRHLEESFSLWLEQQQPTAASWSTLEPMAWSSNLPIMDRLEDQSILITGDVTKKDIYEVVYQLPASRVSHLRLEALADPRLPFGGPGRATIDAGVERGGDFFLSRLVVQWRPKGEENEPWQEISLVDASHSFAGNSRDAKHAIDNQSDTGWGVTGRTGENHWAVFKLAAPVDFAEAGELRVVYEHESFFPASLGRFRLSAANGVPDLVAVDRPVEIDHLLAQPSDKLDAPSLARLKRHFLLTSPLLSEAQAEIERQRKEMPDYPTTLVMQERPKEHTRITYRHHRGEFLSPRETVQPKVPAELHPFAADSASDRLSFANWLVDKRNPLVARVTVNRDWQAFFGTGLCKTTEDFGTQGEYPSHPRLLDWLAVDFMESNWSRKHLHRRIVTSATYRQSSVVTDQQLALDPQNRLLSRGPRVRLEAELIRDVALAVSGLLTHRIGGPSVFPPQNPSITQNSYGPLTWETSPGADRYRRGLYTFAKRTAPYANFMTFDAPSGEACIARRQTSNTPLQALTMLNDETFVEAAQALGRLALESKSLTDEARVEWLYRRTLSRGATPAEVVAVLRFVDQQRQRLSLDTAAAQQISGTPDSDTSPEQMTERATWTMVARILLNLDEFVARQ